MRATKFARKSPDTAPGSFTDDTAGRCFYKDAGCRDASRFEDERPDLPPILRVMGQLDAECVCVPVAAASARVSAGRVAW